MIDILKLVFGHKDTKEPKLSRPPAKRLSLHDPDPDGELKQFILLDPKELIDAANALIDEAVSWKKAWHDQREATGNNYWNGYNHFATIAREFLIPLLTALGQMNQLQNNAGWSMPSSVRSELIAAGWKLVKRSRVMDPPKDGYDLERRIEEWRK